MPAPFLNTRTVRVGHLRRYHFISLPPKRVRRPPNPIGCGRPFPSVYDNHALFHSGSISVFGARGNTGCSEQYWNLTGRHQQDECDEGEREAGKYRNGLPEEEHCFSLTSVKVQMERLVYEQKSHNPGCTYEQTQRG